MICIESFSALLLDLYRSSHSLPTSEFQANAVERLKKQIPFDAATWIMLTRLENGGLHVHDSYFCGLPDGMTDTMNLALEDNLIAQTCRETPDRCFYFPATIVMEHKATAKLARHMDITQVLCIAQRGPVPELLISMSLARRKPSPCFTEDERQLLQALAPHLADLMQTNHVAQMAAIRARETDRRSAMAVVDELGMLIAAEPGFASLISMEWPTWSGPYLPKILYKTDLARRKSFSGKTVSIRFYPVGASLLVTAAQHAPSDALSPRERIIAERFASGQSYKEVARGLDVSPATVRHHLRAIYRKLDVGDKGELSHVLSGRRSIQNLQHMSSLP